MREVGIAAFTVQVSDEGSYSIVGAIGPGSLISPPIK
jgi:hypothetical protein